MTEAEWLEAANAQAMLEFLKGKASDRKLRLFAVACCRRIWHLLPDERSRQAVELAEQFADRALEVDRLQAITEGVNQLRRVVEDLCLREAWLAASHVSLSSYLVAAEASKESDCWDHEQRAQGRLLLDIFGNPFRPTLIPSHLGRSHKRIAINLAHDIYDRRAYDKLPILADALQRAGCTNREVLDHCRRDGERVRGCWVVDLLLGKS